MDIDDFISKSRNGTIFHTQKFLSYHGGRYDTKYYILDDKLVIPYVEEGGKAASHPGSSYGGPVISDSCRYGHVARAINDLQEKYDEIWMRLPPAIFHRDLCDEIDYALFHYGFEVKYELSVAMYLRDNYHLRYADSVRRGIRKAQANLMKIGISTAPSEEFYAGLEKNLARHGATPTHSFEELKFLSDIFDREEISFYSVKTLEGKVVAGSLVFDCNRSASHCFYFWQDYDYQNLRPMAFLVDSIAYFKRTMGTTYLNLGVSTERRGEYLNEGLLSFKEGFGARGVLRKTYNWRRK